MKRILFVLSGHAAMGEGKPAGCYIPELVHPYYVMRKHHIEVDFTSPGGKGPAFSGTDFKDPVLVRLLSDAKTMDRIMAAPAPGQMDPEKYQAIFYTGGHGGLYDFPDNKALINIAESIHKRGGFVTAMCHGPAGLLNLKDENGQLLIKGKRVTSYSRAEEIFYGTLFDIPYVLQDRLAKQGADYSCYGVNQGYVQKQGRVITGQNPMSSQAVGETIATAIIDI
jgi:putative intracellular protease/amidase